MSSGSHNTGSGDSATSTSSTTAAQPAFFRSRAWHLILGALGVVYGDIGTSPLYALRECFHGHAEVPINPDNVLGLLSIIFWMLVFVITFKYLLFVMRADNKGEGGVLALMALVSPGVNTGKWVMLGLCGAALLFADAMITPAVSVLSALEGLKMATDVFENSIVPLAVIILSVLFFFQYRGTEKVGRVFGPIMLTWFTVLGVLGIIQIVQEPSVLQALNPLYMARFVINNGWYGFAVLGSVFLVVTGGEALYADMGHFGRRPIQRGWFGLVFPALTLNYFGQGALLLKDPSKIGNIFYELVPAWGLYPLVILATAATIIASQAVISAAFSLARQAVQLGFFPRMAIMQTSASEIGQVYVPVANWALYAGTMTLLLTFKTSSNLAAAYGVAVTGAMLIDTFLIYQVAKNWNWPSLAVKVAVFAIGFVDCIFFGANCLKIPDGGWLPLFVAIWIYLSMTTWQRGRSVLWQKMKNTVIPVDLFLNDIKNRNVLRVPGTAIFLSDSSGVPNTLLHNFKHNKVLHENVVLLSVRTEEIPHIPPEGRHKIELLGQGMSRITLRYGFSESPDVPQALKDIKSPHFIYENKSTFFLGRVTLLISHDNKSDLAAWRRQLFILMTRNAHDATQFFHIPPGRVVELGMQIEI